VKWRRLPTEVEARQWDGDYVAMTQFMYEHGCTLPPTRRQDSWLSFWVQTSQALVTIELWDYVVAEPDDVGVYPARKDVFEAGHEEIIPGYEYVGPHVHRGNTPIYSGREDKSCRICHPLSR
jgi:hypothetical protein